MCPLFGHRKLRWQAICDSFMNVIDILVHVRTSVKAMSSRTVYHQNETCWYRLKMLFLFLCCAYLAYGRYSLMHFS